MPVRAFVFDAYGTLFDVHAAIARHRAAAGPDADRLSEFWRIKQLEYAWMLSAAGHYVDFWTLTERALDHAFARFPAVDRTLRATLLDAYFQLDAFPDARAALGALKAKGVRTAILSNGSPKMLDGAVVAARIGAELDAVLSVDTIRIYKPRRRGLCARHRRVRNRTGRGRIRFLQPLGRDGRDSVRISVHLGQPRRPAGRVSRVRTGRSGARSRKPRDAGALGGTCNAASSEANRRNVPIKPAVSLRTMRSWDPLSDRLRLDGSSLSDRHHRDEDRSPGGQQNIPDRIGHRVT